MRSLYQTVLFASLTTFVVAEPTEVELPGAAPKAVQLGDYFTSSAQIEAKQKALEELKLQIMALNSKVETLQNDLTTANQQKAGLVAENQELRNALSKIKAESYNKQDVDQKREELSTRVARIEQTLIAENEQLRRQILELTRKETPFPAITDAKQTPSS